MKAVVLSIQPKWCELIAKGQKTVEVRKTKPKLETPFKCYIYCTNSKKQNLRVNSWFGHILHDDDTTNMPPGGYEANGMVIGEFVCDRISTIAYTMDGFADAVDCDTSCLAPKDFIEYGKGKPLYGWHISNLVIYDKPKELVAFYKECAGLDNTGMCWDCEKANGEECDCTVNGQLHLTRPPQSWCYVEEMPCST